MLLLKKPDPLRASWACVGITYWVRFLKRLKSEGTPCFWTYIELNHVLNACQQKKHLQADVKALFQSLKRFK